MDPICEKCRGANINEGAKIKTGAKITAAIMTGLILYCPFDPHSCPYVPPEQHTHNEKYIPLEYQSLIVTVATTAGSIDHDSVVKVIDDPDRAGSKIYILKF